MPELPEVETVMRGLQVAFQGQNLSHVIVRRADLRWPFPANLPQRLEGRKVLSFRRRAKYILMRIEGGQTLLIHLGMSGRMNIGPANPNATPPLHEHMVLQTANGFRAGLVDPRRFGIVDLFPTNVEDDHRLLSALGIEPLSDALSHTSLKAMFSGRRTPIKTALLDQKLVVGLGNIYVCEILFRAGIHPERTTGSIKDAELRDIARIIPDVLNEAIASGGSSLRDYVQTDGSKGGFQELHRVYGREGEPCPTCAASGRTENILRITQSGRSTFYCARCQKAPAG
ncbi:bifunctional DNA-formamidopyrimidine glycosylase/DNA-(apurinic or apyrimidinic site) lyase [Gluconobacter wancherniae]|uniref:bifunctional DNA-formamidopyrimidine glycosylase/DNA-(apurinic or apyrimidinic site) lyase n=1 Tax=Gluconobacter wancherniae TaxID=1307955 RepID=UPI001B8BFC43|nr:bifunctional DNA-formamidopyrimidine glycosylase/DNA-(apurinic or apyrimidinic site) lyase [Gluconobacter wancherniae]MBS1063223.1 bifunctional DNA-formamidopyrimidine glycosylase/DNA-(apurinic or apyrimidinic site) lyase [Gluconobacter wancherniae]